MSPLSYALEDKVAVLRMDDGKANALSSSMLSALSEALTKAEAEATALVLTGRPDRFCAGFDLRIMMSGPEAAKELLSLGADVLMKLYGTPLPLVIAGTGHALAGGALVLLTGDVRYGAAGPYKIGLNEVSIGLPVPVLAMELARDRLLASELGRATLQSQIYGPDDAVRVGYLDAVLAADVLLDRAKEEAARLGALPRSAYGPSKERLRGKTIAHIRASMDGDMKSLMSQGG